MKCQFVDFPPPLGTPESETSRGTERFLLVIPELGDEIPCQVRWAHSCHNPPILQIGEQVWIEAKSWASKHAPLSGMGYLGEVVSFHGGCYNTPNPQCIVRLLSSSWFSGDGRGFPKVTFTNAVTRYVTKFPVE